MVWQRVLFSIYGIDIASVTVVVTAFMMGLGVGSLLGGALSRRSSRALLGIFALCELGIGLFGLVSLDLFAWVGSRTLGAGHLFTGVLAFVLVLVPTTLMGASLPLLVEWEDRRRRNVGQVVGLLYFVNTLGAAAGSFLAVLVLLGAFGLRATTAAAAALNLFLGLAVLWPWYQERTAAP